LGCGIAPPSTDRHNSLDLRDRIALKLRRIAQLRGSCPRRHKRCENAHNAAFLLKFDAQQTFEKRFKNSQLLVFETNV
jgi:hypothetical protein